jgi:hypothetical protein
MRWLRIAGDLVRIPAAWDVWRFNGLWYRVTGEQVECTVHPDHGWRLAVRAAVVPAPEATW